MSALDDLQKAAVDYRDAQAARDKALADVLAAVLAADKAGGHSRAEIIAASGLARQTVYDALNAAKAAAS